MPDRTRDDIFNNRPGRQLREKILNLPDPPGVYVYVDRYGKVIYVGKAKRLKRRVASYFNRRHDSTRTNLLVRNIVDTRFIVVGSEEDALHPENAMIKEYQPRYNVLLKDDKSYPWIVVTKELFPASSRHATGRSRESITALTAMCSRQRWRPAHTRHIPSAQLPPFP